MSLTETKTATDQGLKPVRQFVGQAVDELADAVRLTQGDAELATMEAAAAIKAEVERTGRSFTTERALMVLSIKVNFPGGWEWWRPDWADPAYDALLVYKAARRELGL